MCWKGLGRESLAQRAGGTRLALRARVGAAVKQQARQRQAVVRGGHVQQRAPPLHTGNEGSEPLR